ncbi:MAG: NAD-dependent deacylase [Planctomycetota bacterium]|nr:NAD-dependent deacylase [Planctomycetota bacterium]
MNDTQIPAELIHTWRRADFVAVLTGAGVSAESGIPTFRDALTGMWAKFDALQLATVDGFKKNPELVTRWYDERRVACAAREPNAGHHALVRLQDEVEARGGTFVLITQNVDRLHQRAGSRGVIELHGALNVWRCSNGKCGRQREETGGPFGQYPPLCEACGNPRRPGVVWFQENLDPATLLAAQQAAAASRLFLSLGTSSLIHPAAGLVDLIRFNGGKSLEINPEATANSGAMTWVIRGKTGEVLPRLADAVGAGN